MPDTREIYARSVEGMNERQRARLERRRRERPQRRGAVSPLAAAAIAGGAVLVAGLVGRRWAPDRNHPRIKDWYGSLEKPAFTPPDPVFGAVWPALEVLLAVGGYRLLREARSPQRDTALALWAVNMAMIPAWTKIFFGERSTAGGFAAATAQLGAGIAYAEAARRVDGTSAGLAVPYAAWLAFATVTAEEVWREN